MSEGGFARTWLALFLVALALRPQIIAIGPLLPAMQADLAINHAIAGLLAAIPVLCMGIFALVAPWLGRRIGVERAVSAGVAAIIAFGLLRAIAPEAMSVLLLTVGVGVGVALIGPLLPIVIHQRVPSRAAVATGAYTGGIVVGATVAAGLAVPLAGPQLDWRLPLAIFSVVAVGSLVVWPLIGGRPKRDALPGTIGEIRPPAPPRLPWRRGRAWALALLFGAQSILFYAAVSWLPSVYAERGWTATDAGLLVALMSGVSLISNFAAPAMSERRGSRREQLLLSAAASFIGVLGIAALPALTLVWVIALGIGLGAVFPLVLTLPVDLAERPAAAGGLAAIMLFGGYILSAVGPLLLGIVRDLTGTFDLSLWLLVGVGAGLMAACWLLVPAGLGQARAAVRA